MTDTSTEPTEPPADTAPAEPAPGHRITISHDDLSLLAAHLDLDRYTAPSYDPETGEALFPEAVDAAVIDAALADPGWRTPILRTQLVAYAADRRWQVASGGIAVPLPGGMSMSVPTDDTAYGRLKGAAQDMAAGIITEPITIVLGDDAVQATQAMVTALYAAISQHWQTCYAVQGGVVTAINAGTITTHEQIDAAPWPANG